MNIFHCYESEPQDGTAIQYEIHDDADNIVGTYASYWEMMMRMLMMGQRRWLMFSHGRVAQIYMQKVGDPEPASDVREVGQAELTNLWPGQGE